GRGTEPCPDPAGAAAWADGAAGLGERFELPRSISALAKNVISINNNIADINPNANLDALVRRYIRVALGHTALNIDSAAHSIDNANELHQRPISGGFNNSAAMFGDLRIDQFFAVRLELAQRAFLIGSH